MKKNLVLTGMMGVGKSTIGKLLAKKLGLKFVDIDRIIEIREQSTISEIFKKRGEDHFRKIEKKVSLEELKKKKLVIALGGGAFIDLFIRKAVKSTSTSIWLDLDLTVLVSRLKNAKTRPLLDNGEIEKTVNKIYSKRKKIYNDSDFRIKYDTANTKEIVDNIIKLYESRRNKS